MGKEKYRPSNGTEGMQFINKFCDRCVFEYCDLLADTMAYKIDDPKYPEEWIYDKNDNPICTKFLKSEIKTNGN